MGNAQPTRSIRRARGRRRFRRARRGVVSVVGTLLALLVFFALFGIFLTQYVPLWMTDNESQFTNQAQASLAQLKSDVDAQYALGGPPTYSVPFTVSSEGIPLLAQPTGAVLSILPPFCPAGFTSTGVPNQPSACVFQKVSLYVPFELEGTGVQNHPYNQWAPSGLLQMQLPNRYYTPQTLVFEDDAVVQAQGAHQWMLLPPPLNITKVGTNTTVRSSFVQVFGNSSVFSGQGTKDVASHFVYSTPAGSLGRFSNGTTPVPFTFTYVVGTRNLCGWYTYLYTLGSATSPAGSSSAPKIWLSLNNTSGTGNVSFPFSGSNPNPQPFSLSACANSAGTTYDITFSVQKVTYSTLFSAGVQLGFTVGGL